MNNYRVSFVRGTNPEYPPDQPWRPSFQGGAENNLVFVTGGQYSSILTAGGKDVIIVFGNDNNSYVYAGFGDDNDVGIAVGRGNVSFYGDAGDDYLIGGAGSDGLVGGDGADVIRGGGGNDFIGFDVRDTFVAGETGADTFFFNPTSVDITTPTNVPTALVMTQASGAVAIADFNASEGDILNMAALGASQENVYSDMETNSTVFMTPESTVVIVGVAFGDVAAAVAAGSLILDYGGRG